MQIDFLLFFCLHLCQRDFEKDANAHCYENQYSCAFVKELQCIDSEQNTFTNDTG